MKKIILLAGLLFYSLILFSQKISNVDFDAIKKTLEDTPALYKQLLDRFLQSDSTLSNEDYYLVYYGQCFQSSYNPNDIDHENYDKFKEYFSAENYIKALPYAVKMIDKKPLDMEMTLKALLCYYFLNDDANRLKLLPRYNNIMLTIHRSGNGLSEATAFVSMNMGDTYELMTTMKLEKTSSTTKGECVVMTLKENKNHVKEVYFNVSKPYQAMINGK
ncbi:MAG TPA: DUF4919 domain-containing protein [Chitinophagaceae bacterium]|nr:DUF4919 domain-containing protein [Chitinophagaceae bacterium]